MDPVKRAAAQRITQLKQNHIMPAALNQTSLKCLSDATGRDQAVEENEPRAVAAFENAAPSLETQPTLTTTVCSPVFLVLIYLLSLLNFIF